MLRSALSTQQDNGEGTSGLGNPYGESCDPRQEKEREHAAFVATCRLESLCDIEKGKGKIFKKVSVSVETVHQMC